MHFLLFLLFWFVVPSFLIIIESLLTIFLTINPRHMICLHSRVRITLLLLFILKFVNSGSFAINNLPKFFSLCCQKGSYS